MKEPSFENEELLILARCRFLLLPLCIKLLSLPEPAMTEQAPAADNDDEESDEGSLAELLCLPDVLA